MPAPILATKLCIPPARPGIVSRPRLVERLNESLVTGRKLALISAPLCNAVTERGDGKEMLDILEHSNLFIIPLDDQRQWYRYRPLFAEVLQVRLLKEQPDQVISLHQRASEWYEQNGSAADAIRHYARVKK